MPRTADLSNISHDDLLHAVHDLVARNQVTAQEVRHAAGNGSRIAEIERQLAVLRGGNGVARTPGRPAKNGTAKPKRTFTLTPKGRATRKLQGQYIGTLRALTADQKLDAKAIAKADGIAAGLRAAKKYKAENIKVTR